MLGLRAAWAPRRDLQSSRSARQPWRQDRRSTVVLLTLTLFLSFTGYLLPWDQLSIWAVTVGTNMARATPLLGHEGPFGPELGMQINNDVRFVLLRGTQVGPPTLLRFNVLHCIFLPLVASIFMIVHFWRIRKDGGISGPEIHEKKL